MQLPNGNQAQLGDKLERYVLNMDHFKGRHKSILFQNRLGITLENKAILEEALKDAAHYGDAVLFKRDRYGDQYDIEFMMRTEIGQSWVLSCWIIPTDGQIPRLTNAYPIKKAIKEEDTK